MFLVKCALSPDVCSESGPTVLTRLVLTRCGRLAGVLRLSFDYWSPGEPIVQSCDEGEYVSGLSAEVQYLVDEDYEYVITSIDLECSSSGKHGGVGSVVFEVGQFDRVASKPKGQAVLGDQLALLLRSPPNFAQCNMGSEAPLVWPAMLHNSKSRKPSLVAAWAQQLAAERSLNRPASVQCPPQ